MLDKSAFRTETFDEIVRSDSVEQALYIIRDRYPIGNVTYHMMQSISMRQNIDAPFVKTTYPAEWVARYLMKNYIMVDPVLKEGMLRALPFNWTELTPETSALVMMKDFQEFDLGKGGFSIPITDKKGRRALLSLNSTSSEEDWDEIITLYIDDWIELGNLLHRKVIIELFGKIDPAPTLTPRELETLNFAAQGMDHKQIAEQLNISEHTVRSYQQSLRFKLSCSSMTHAVAKASKLRILNSN